MKKEKKKYDTPIFDIITYSCDTILTASDGQLAESGVSSGLQEEDGGGGGWIPSLNH